MLRSVHCVTMYVRNIRNEVWFVGNIVKIIVKIIIQYNNAILNG